MRHHGLLFPAPSECVSVSSTRATSVGEQQYYSVDEESGRGRPIAAKKAKPFLVLIILRGLFPEVLSLRPALSIIGIAVKL